MSPEELLLRLADIAAELGLHKLTAVTDTHVVTVQEQSLWDEPWPGGPPLYGFDIEVRAFEL